MREKIERVLINHGGLNLWDVKVRSSIVDAVLEVVGNSTNTIKSNKKTISDVPNTREPDDTVDHPHAPRKNKSSNDNTDNSRDSLKKNKLSPRYDKSEKNSSRKKPAGPSRKKKVKKSKSSRVEELELMGQNTPTPRR